VQKESSRLPILFRNPFVLKKGSYSINIYKI